MVWKRKAQCSVFVCLADLLTQYILSELPNLGGSLCALLYQGCTVINVSHHHHHSCHQNSAVYCIVRKWMHTPAQYTAWCVTWLSKLSSRWSTSSPQRWQQASWQSLFWETTFRICIAIWVLERVVACNFEKGCWNFICNLNCHL